MTRGVVSAARVVELERELAASEAARIELQSRLELAEEARARLERMLVQSCYDRFGAKSEKLDADQRHLPLEDLEVAEGMLAAAGEAARRASAPPAPARDSRPSAAPAPPSPPAPRNGLWTAIGRLVDVFTPQECANYFAAAGCDAA